MPRLALIACCLLLLGAPALAAEKRELKDKNFTWTLPSADWTFQEPASDMAAGGFVLGAQHKGGQARAWVRVVPAQGVKAADLAEEIRDTYSQGLSKQARAQVGTGRLSGLAGAMAVVAGTKDGVAALYQGFVISNNDTLHALVIEVFHGAEKDLGSELDALRRGYRLIAGAGPEEKPESALPTDPGAPAADSPGGGFPAGGPKSEGRAAVFPSHNVKWTLPEGSPWKWGRVTGDEKKIPALMLEATARLERKAQGDEPTSNQASVVLVIGERRAGATPEKLVNDSGVQEQFIKEQFNGNVDASRTKVDPSRDIGNSQGASFMLVGREGKVARYFIFLVVMLRDRQYEWRVVLEGGKDVQSAFGKPLGELIAGIEFPNAVEPVSGPAGIPGIGSLPSLRGHGVDKETDTPLPGGSAKKPKGVASVPWEGGDAAQRLAWEARSADGMAYLFFDARNWSTTDQAVSRRKLEDWVTDREGQWRSAAGSDAVTITKGKDPWFDGAWGGAKGVAYKFTGAHAGHPFVEYGWVVRAKGSIVVLRAQFGGTDAEKVLDAVWKAIKKGVKIS